MYMYELRSFEGMCPVNPSYTAFCLLDFDVNKHALNVYLCFVFLFSLIAFNLFFSETDFTYRFNLQFYCEESIII